MSAERVAVINEVWDLSPIEQQKGRVISMVDETVDHMTKASEKIKKLDFSFNTGSINLQELKQLEQEAERITKEAAKNVQLLADAQLKLAKTKKEEAYASKAQTDETIKLAREKAKLDKIMAKEEANLKKTKSAYEQLKKTYNQVSAEAKSLGIVHGVNSTIFKEHAANAHAMHTQLLQVEMAVGQAQRQVGNYNVVGEHFNQILRELPNAGLSMRTFLVAISNNISQLVESMSKAIKNGDSFKSVFMSMGKQLVGVTGIINLAVLAMTYFATHMSSTGKEAKSLTEQMDELTTSLGNYIKATRAGSVVLNDTLSAQAANLKREIELMKARGDSEAEISKKQQQYHDLRVKDLSQEIGMYGQAQNMMRTYVTQYLRGDDEIRTTKAQLQKFLSLELDMNDELVKTTLEKMDLAAEEAYTIKKNQQLTNAAAIEKIKLSKIFNTQIRDLEEQTAEELNAQAIEGFEFQKSLDDKAKKEYEEMLKKRKEAYDKWAHMEEKDRKAQFDMQKALLEEQIEAEERILNSEDSTDDQKIQALTNLAKMRTDLATETANFEVLNSNKSAKEIETIYTQLGITLRKILQETKDKEIELSKEVIAREEQLAEEQEKRQKDNAKRVLENHKKSVDLDKIELKEKMNGLAKWVQGLQQGAKIYNDLMNQRSATYMKALDVELQAVDASEERERLRAERTITDKDVLEKRITDIEADAETERQAINDKRREQERRDAERTKALALVNIMANMIIGISKEIASKGVAGLATSAAIGVYIGTLTAAIGALAVPAYEDGVINKGFDGPAIVGEGRKKNKYVPEFVKMPGKKGFITDGPTFMANLPKHSDVIPLPGMLDVDPDMMAIANNVMLAAGGNNAKTEELLGEVVDVLKKQPQRTVTIKDGVTHEEVQIGNARHDFLSKAYYS